MIKGRGFIADASPAVRLQLTELRAAARFSSGAPTAAAAQAIERRSVEIDAELDYLAAVADNVSKMIEGTSRK